MTRAAANGHALTVAVIDYLEAHPYRTMRDILRKLVPQGHNGHAIRACVTRLMGQGALKTGTGIKRVTYRVTPAAAPVAPRKPTVVAAQDKPAPAIQPVWPALAVEPIAAPNAAPAWRIAA